MLFYVLFNKISFHPFLNTVAENLIQLISNTGFMLLKLLPFGHSFIQNVIDISNESHLQVKDKLVYLSPSEDVLPRIEHSTTHGVTWPEN